MHRTAARFSEKTVPPIGVQIATVGISVDQYDMVKRLVSLLPPSQNKYNFMVQNLSHKECNFDLATIKDKSLRKLLIQKTSQCLDFSCKRQGAI